MPVILKDRSAVLLIVISLVMVVVTIIMVTIDVVNGVGFWQALSVPLSLSLMILCMSVSRLRSVLMIEGDEMKSVTRTGERVILRSEIAEFKNMFQFKIVLKDGSEFDPQISLSGKSISILNEWIAVELNA